MITYKHHNTYLMGPLVSLAGQMVTFTNVSVVLISATFGIVGARGAETNKQRYNTHLNEH